MPTKSIDVSVDFRLVCLGSPSNSDLLKIVIQNYWFGRIILLKRTRFGEQLFSIRCFENHPQLHVLTTSKAFFHWPHLPWFKPINIILNGWVYHENNGFIKSCSFHSHHDWISAVTFWHWEKRGDCLATFAGCQNVSGSGGRWQLHFDIL